MSARRLRFADRPEAQADTLTVVLDPWWVPDHPDPSRVPVTELTNPILRSIDLVTGSLALLDDWAARAGLPAALEIDGVSWWVRVRMAARWELKELLLWCHALAAVSADARPDTIMVPAGRSLLVAAARARATAAHADGRPIRVVVEGSRGRDLVGRTLGRGRRAARRVAVAAPSVTDRLWAWRHRVSPATGRIAMLAVEPPAVLVIAWAGAFQLFESPAGPRQGDPLLTPVLDHLREQGLGTATLVSGLGTMPSGGWRSLRDDPTTLWSTALPSPRPASHAEREGRQALRRAIGAAAGVPLVAAGCDLGPAMASILDGFASSWLADEQLSLRQLDRLLERIRPGALLLNREATRTPVIAAARRRRIPVVAVQHGMVYPGTPEYCLPGGVPDAIRPDRTCVFGEFERQLVAACGYPPDSLVVTGSPRRVAVHAAAGPAAGDPAAGQADRAALRHELGVVDGERLLVVSVAHNTLGDLDAAEFLGRLLGEPIPGVRVVVKAHPQDRTEPGHVRLLAGLARAAGARPPRVAVVRDIDLYRLLGAADAHLGQHSTVLTDAVVAAIPNMIVVGQGYEDPLGYARAGVAVPVRDAAGVRAFMADPRPPDPAERRAFLDAHFRPGDGAAAVAEVVASIAQGRTTGATAPPGDAGQMRGRDAGSGQSGSPG